MADDTPKTQPKKLLAKGNGYADEYGYMRIAELRDYIPKFKEFYYEKKLESPKRSAIDILNAFNEIIKPARFYPYTTQYRLWRKKWDIEIQGKLMGVELAMTVPEVKVVKTRDDQNVMIVPGDSELEQGAKTLGGELMNDAMTMLKGDQQNEEFYDDEVLIKRRNYVLNVFNFVMRAVNQKEALAIKRQAEKRETASFLMDLVRRSTAGKITQEELDLMKNSIKPNNEQPMAVHN